MMGLKTAPAASAAVCALVSFSESEAARKARFLRADWVLLVPASMNQNKGTIQNDYTVTTCR